MNRKKPAALLSLILSVLLLSSCAGPRDLATEPNALPTREQGIAKRISEKAATFCAIGPRRRKDDHTPTSGHGMELRKPPVIVKLYSSTNSSFYRAEALIDGVWDNVYFNNKTEQVVCGEQNWQATKGAVDVIFREVSTDTGKMEVKAEPPPAAIPARVQSETPPSRAETTQREDLSTKQTKQKMEVKAAPLQAANAEKEQSVAPPSRPETMRREDLSIKEPKQNPETTRSVPRINSSTLSKPSNEISEQAVDQSASPSQRSAAPREVRGKCVIKPVMTDEEIARCKQT